MPRITPIRWRTLECIFIKDGFVFERQEGSHRSYSKKGVKRPIIIPTYKEVQIKEIQSNMRTASMSRDKYFAYLKECK